MVEEWGDESEEGGIDEAERGESGSICVGEDVEEELGREARQI
jgi:hypothetical protein